jgi:hypothetical protein
VRHRFAIGLVFLAGLASTLALPWRSGGSGSTPSGTPEAAFEALVADDSAREARVLTPEERLRLLATMRAQGPTPLARFLERVVAKTSGEEARVLALECLADCATARPRSASRPGSARPSCRR